MNLLLASLNYAAAAWMIALVISEARQSDLPFIAIGLALFAALSATGSGNYFARLWYEEQAQSERSEVDDH